MIKTILFDVDGVMLSEERYFDASALTVWELLHSPQYLGLTGDTFTPAPAEPVIRQVREQVFARDEVLNFIKSRGINSNWDMVYLTFSYQLIRLLERLREHRPQDVAGLLGGPIDRTALQRVREWVKEENLSFAIDYAGFIADFAKGKAVKAEMLLDLNRIARERCGVATENFSRTSPLWVLCQETFQEWYLGDSRVEESIGRKTAQPGKRGFLYDEIPIVEPDRFREILRALKGKGLTLGIGTGRPTIETHVPLKALGLLDLFDDNRVVTASHVLAAETAFPDRAPLAKPHPYCYLKALYGLDTPDEVILETPLPLSHGDEVLIVGDSLADLLAARAMGCRFAATLTGLSGKAARSTFERERADAILDDASELLRLFA